MIIVQGACFYALPSLSPLCFPPPIHGYCLRSGYSGGCSGDAPTQCRGVRLQRQGLQLLQRHAGGAAVGGAAAGGAAAGGAAAGGAAARGAAAGGAAAGGAAKLGSGRPWTCRNTASARVPPRRRFRNCRSSTQWFSRLQRSCSVAVCRCGISWWEVATR